MFAVEGTDLRLEVGATYPSEEQSVVALRLIIPPGRQLNRSEIRKALRDARRRLYAVFDGNAAELAARSLGFNDDPDTIPSSRLADPDNMLTIFWMQHPEHTTPVLAFRSSGYSEEWVPKFRNCIEKAGRSAYRWFPKPWSTWAITRTTFVPTVLGYMRAQGFKLRWVNRPGFPPAPPIQEIDEPPPPF